MRNLALSIATVLVLAVVSPAFAQPFADVPTDHWAFDAIAELAAKGVIEGYPDGTFKGDRGITRYEVAMIVARILARIEAIKIPGPAAPAPAPAAPPAAVTPAQVQTIQRLVNEFRAELAALGVRVTAVEEELAALKQVTGATKVTGNASLFYDYTSGDPSTDSDMRLRYQFTAKSGPYTVVARLRFGTFDFGVDVAAGGISTPGFDLAYIDWSSGFFGTTWRVGSQLYTLGPNGLLFEGQDYIDGVKVDGSFGPVALTGSVFADDTLAADHWGISAGFNLLAGWETGAQYYMLRPYSGAASSNGWGVNLSGNLGLPVAVDYASWTPAVGAASTGYRVDVTLDLGGMMGGGWSLGLFAKDYGAAGATGPANTEADTTTYDELKWNIDDGYGATFSMPLMAQWTLSATYETGKAYNADAVSAGAIAAGATFTEWEFKLSYDLGGASVDLYYDRQEIPGASSDTYALEVNWSW